MKRVKKIIGIILIELIIIVACVWLGRQMNNLVEEKKPLTINKIALVNLDSGIEINKEYKYYGTEFITELDDNFEITSLEQARRGLENDLYAAYIIIPATFSKNIESVNKSELIKSNITYKINPNLDYVIREEVVTDIWLFNNNLSTNIEYVYVDAILKGVHVVQDGADELLENDLKDLQAVLKFTETDLIVDPEYPDEKHVDSNIEKLDISKIYARMQNVFSDLSMEYKASQTGAQEKYDKLIHETTAISTKMGNLNTEISEVANIDDGNEFKIENDEQLNSFINEYNLNLTQWKQDYDDQSTYNFDSYMDQCQSYTNKQLEDMNANHKKYLKEYYMTAFAQCDVIVRNEIDSEDQKEFNEYAKGLKIYDATKKIIYELKNEIDRLNDEIYMLNGELDKRDNTIADMSAIIQKLGGNYSVSYTEVNGTVTERNFLSKTYDTEIISALMEDFLKIKETGQEERNAALRDSMGAWLKEDLIHYGVDEEDVKNIDLTEIDGEMVAELIDDLYKTKLDLSIEPVTEEDTTIETKKDVSDKSQDDSQKEEIDENEKTEYEIKLEKRAKVLFANTYEPSFMDVEMLNNLISGEVVSPISSSIMKKYNELTNSYTSLNTAWTNWSTKLNVFKIDSYGNEEKRNAIEKNFNDNLERIQTTVNTKDTEYQMYVTKANETNSNNLELWETSIQSANKATRNNINNSIKDIKITREQMNTSNNNLITNISNVLPYSRIGELENRNVYSYITSPIVQEDISENKVINAVKEKNKESKYVKNNTKREMIIVSFGIILCMVAGGVLIRYIKKRDKYLQKQNLE